MFGKWFFRNHFSGNKHNPNNSVLSFYFFHYFFISLVYYYLCRLPVCRGEHGVLHVRPWLMFYLCWSAITTQSTLMIRYSWCFFYKVSYINKVKQTRKRMNFIIHNYIYAIILFKFLWYKKKEKIPFKHSTILATRALFRK